MTPERFKKMCEVLDRRQPDLTLITDSVHKGQNLSALLRTADAVGVMEMHCMLPESEFRAHRGTAMGSQRWLRVHRYCTVIEPVRQLQRQGYQVLAAHPTPSSRDFRDVDFCRPTAIVLGAEKHGLSPEALASTDGQISIPLQGMVASLNVSVAAAMILAEAQRQRLQAGLYQESRLPEKLRAQMLFEWAYPELAKYCQQRDLEYPPLDEAGLLEDGSGWYAAVRAAATGD